MNERSQIFVGEGSPQTKKAGKPEETTEDYFPFIIRKIAAAPNFTIELGWR